MANSAADARASEQEIRKQLIEGHAVDAMVAVGPNMFYTVTLPCTLWFLDRGKAQNFSRRQCPIHRCPSYLSPDRSCPPRLDRASNRLSRQHRPPLSRRRSRLHTWWRRHQSKANGNLFFLARESGKGEGKLKFRDVPGLCKAATLKEIGAQGWSLNPGRYVGVAPGEAVSDEDSRNNWKN